jgi:2-polyprenyl-6-methoxyphenol hydroxylase-like FAD-dependent oxidoreductase
MDPEIAVIGGGIVGLTLALHLKQRGIDCRVYEAAPSIEPLGVGITLLPHAMREFVHLGLEDKLRAAGIENRESAFFNRHGQLIYKEPRGLLAGYDVPEIGIHRGKLHAILYDAAITAIGPERILTNHQCTGVEQSASSVRIAFRETSTGRTLSPAEADIAIACDGVNSAIRRQFYPSEALQFAGINTWRGVTRRKPILDGRTYLRVGSIETGKIVIYPIVDRVDDEGNQLINWMAEIRRPDVEMNDWNRRGDVADFLPIYENWRFDWLDVPALIETADLVLEYPMVDKDPVDRWTFGRVTLMGDAAHPMYPRGSNGAAQGAIDARTFAEQLERLRDPVAALCAYERARIDATARVVRTNREFPPDYLIIKVDELTGGAPFDDIDDVISQQELREISERYKQVAGFSLREAGATKP